MSLVVWRTASVAALLAGLTIVGVVFGIPLALTAVHTGEWRVVLLAVGVGALFLVLYALFASIVMLLASLVARIGWGGDWVSKAAMRYRIVVMVLAATGLMLAVHESSEDGPWAADALLLGALAGFLGAHMQLAILRHGRTVQTPPRRSIL